MKTKRIVVFGTAVLALASSGLAKEDEDNAHLWETKVESVTVFKNGLGFFQRQGSVELNDGWCTADAVPPACFGAFSIYSHQEYESVDIVGSGPGEVIEFDDVDAPSGIDAVKEVLASYENMKVALLYRQNGSDRQASGKLVSSEGSYAVLQTENQSLAVPMEDIEKLQVLEKPLRVHVTADEKKVESMRAASAGVGGVDFNKTTLGMAYLRQGITWIPEYTLELIDDETAELTLRGTLVNEAEDLIHCDVNFVVGVPNFVHTDSLAPIAIGQVIRTIGAAVSSPNIANGFLNNSIANYQTQNMEPAFFDLDVDSSRRNLDQALGSLPSWEGTGSTDFKVYTREDLTLRRGEKAIVTLFVKRIAYNHVYRWAPPGDIQHLLVFKNDTDTPFTTGPCLVISDGNALSEDMLKYVPQGSSGEFPVTTAINVMRKQEESETDRKLKAHEPKDDYFVDLVSLDGKLRMRNHDKVPVKLSIDLKLSGKPLKASDEGEISLDTNNLKLLERRGSIQWMVEMKPGEEKELEYSYERYVPSY
ncbi:MAG: hypothetical protein JXR23_06365 [Pontiellaceae bacterium]|nr:hypothetical protein [Pontiellaceae bacterium]